MFFIYTAFPYTYNPPFERCPIITSETRIIQQRNIFSEQSKSCKHILPTTSLLIVYLATYASVLIAFVINIDFSHIFFLSADLNNFDKVFPYCILSLDVIDSTLFYYYFSFRVKCMNFKFTVFHFFKNFFEQF